MKLLPMQNQGSFYSRVLSPKDADGMTNSNNPEQTAPLIWIETVCTDFRS